MSLRVGWTVFLLLLLLGGAAFVVAPPEWKPWFLWTDLDRARLRNDSDRLEEAFQSTPEYRVLQRLAAGSRSRSYLNVISDPFFVAVFLVGESVEVKITIPLGSDGRVRLEHAPEVQVARIDRISRLEDERLAVTTKSYHDPPSWEEIASSAAPSKLFSVGRPVPLAGEYFGFSTPIPAPESSRDPVDAAK